MTEIGLGNCPADASLWKTNYEYGELDANGNLDAVKNTGNIARQTLTVPGTSFVQSYKYDSLYRLTEASEKTGTNQNWIQNWSYDRYGNRLGFSQNIAGSEETIFVYDAGGKLIGEYSTVVQTGSNAKTVYTTNDEKKNGVDRAIGRSCDSAIF